MSRLPALKPTRLPVGVEEYRIRSQPSPGFWLIRLRTRSPEMPAAIVECHHEPGNPENNLDTGPILVANVGYEERDPLDLWHRRGREITESEYKFQMARVAWVRDHSPSEPEAAPRKAVDIPSLRPIGPYE